MYCKYQESKLAEMNNSASEVKPDGNSANKVQPDGSSSKFWIKNPEKENDEVRQTKAYEIMKYETIAQMNASSVSAYLRQQCLKPNVVPGSETDGILQKHREEIENHAATVIQQFFRRTTRQKQIDRIFYTWKWIPLEKRIRYIEAIAEQMSGGTIPRRADHSIIKNKLDEHKRTMYTSINNYVRREQLVRHIENDLMLLNSFCYNDTSTSLKLEITSIMALLLKRRLKYSHRVKTSYFRKFRTNPNTLQV
ncbi:hypothetical protein DINM_002845 [Dirofilaria immitis]|nr:hypothetical protein [Dirofilaria immitis]